jgi:hypothetical protein
MIRVSKITISTFALALFFCLCSDSFACECAASGPPCQAFWQADTVFVGQVKAKDLKARYIKGINGEELRVFGRGEARVTFTITEAFRGAPGKEVDIFTNDDAYAYQVCAGSEADIRRRRRRLISTAFQGKDR